MKNYKNLLCLFLALLFSCKKETENINVKSEASSSQKIIQEAHSWFDNEFKPNAVIQQRSKTNKISIDKEPLWEKATVSKIKDNNYIYVPLRYETGYSAAKGERRRLVISYDINGNKKVEVMKLIADQSYLLRKKGQISTKDFTGIALFYDWQDNYLHGTNYQDALPIGSITKNSTSTDNTNIRKRTAGDCTIVTVIWYSQACIDGSCYAVQEVYRETYTLCNGDGGGGTGDGGGIGGGGGGIGGGGSGGGGGNDSCGDAVICPDGTTNPKLEEEKEAIIFHSGPIPPEASEYDCGQLREWHLDNFIQPTQKTLADFVAANIGQTREHIVSQRGEQRLPFLVLPLGPNIRYISDPLNNDIVIDLRHMLEVGHYGPEVANSLEIIQYIGMQESAFNHQDYYSNSLGFEFYYHYHNAIISNPYNFANYVSEFLNNASLRNKYNNPELVNQRCP